MDTNVLIALLDPVHVHHTLAHAWFQASGQHGWATCAITQNGVLRIVGSPRYPNSPGGPAAVAALLAEWVQHPGHEFWSDEVSLVADRRVDAGALVSSGQITDTYLLALATARGGKLATLDRRLATNAVRGGREALEVVE